MVNFWMFLRAFLLAQILAGCMGTGQKESTQRPNVILILSDDQGWGDLHSHGNPYLATPILDRMAEEGASFDRFYVSPLCAPTRASLLTGRYERRTGVSWVTKGLENMHPEEITLAELFRDAGYSTACFGKWHNGAHWPNHPNRQGFEHFIGFCGGHWSNYFDTELEFNGMPFPTNGYISDVLTEEAMRFIGNQNATPFFCFLSYNVPHSPFQVPDRWYDRYAAMGLNEKDASVYGMVENMDWNIGRLISAVDSLGLGDNTLIIFLSDNGPNGQRYNGGMRGIKGSIDEGGVRVPCLMRWPTRIPAGLRIAPIAAHIDLLPTLTSLCDLTHPKPGILDGVDLADLIEGTTREMTPRYIFTHRSLEVPGAEGAIRSDRYRMVLWACDTMLYDMTEDPGQTNDISRYRRDVVLQLAEAYTAWYASSLRDYRPATGIRLGFPDQEMASLPAHEASFTGGIRFMEGHGWAHDWLIDWKNIQDSIFWELTVVEETEYRIELLYSCAAGDQGSAIVATYGDESTVAVIGEAFDAPMTDSPDRVPRIEVYEKPWGRLELGTLHLPAGKGVLSLRARQIAGKSVAEVKGLQLTKTGR
jgi:arylsulfatase A-like enzyme